MEDLGKVFREFRISKNYSLKEAAGEACSTSQLSRFELGESDLAASRFFDILDNIHVTIENFMDKARNFQHHEQDVYKRQQFFLSQNFNVAEQFTGQPGSYVPVGETVRGFKEILDGKYDHLPEDAFRGVGSVSYTHLLRNMARIRKQNELPSKRKSIRWRKDNRITSISGHV